MLGDPLLDPRRRRPVPRRSSPVTSGSPAGGAHRRNAHRRQQPRLEVAQERLGRSSSAPPPGPRRRGPPGSRRPATAAPPARRRRRAGRRRRCRRLAIVEPAPDAGVTRDVVLGTGVLDGKLPAAPPAAQDPASRAEPVSARRGRRRRARCRSPSSGWPPRDPSRRNLHARRASEPAILRGAFAVGASSCPCRHTAPRRRCGRRRRPRHRLGSR